MKTLIFIADILQRIWTVAFNASAKKISEIYQFCCIYIIQASIVVCLVSCRKYLVACSLCNCKIGVGALTLALCT